MIVFALLSVGIAAQYKLGPSLGNKSVESYIIFIERIIKQNITFSKFINFTYDFRIKSTETWALNRDFRDVIDFLKKYINLNQTFSGVWENAMWHVHGVAISSYDFAQFFNLSSPLSAFPFNDPVLVRTFSLFISRILRHWAEVEPVVDSLSIKKGEIKSILKDFVELKLETITLERIFDAIDANTTFFRKLFFVAAHFFGDRHYTFAATLRDLGLSLSPFLSLQKKRRAFDENAFGMQWVLDTLFDAISCTIEVLRFGKVVIAESFKFLEEFLGKSHLAKKDILSHVFGSIRSIFRDFPFRTLNEFNRLLFRYSGLVERIEDLQDERRQKANQNQHPNPKKKHKTKKPSALSKTRERIWAWYPVRPSYLRKETLEINGLIDELDELTAVIETETVANNLDALGWFEAPKRSLSISGDDFAWDLVADLDSDQLIVKFAQMLVDCRVLMPQTPPAATSAYKYSYRFVGPQSPIPAVAKRILDFFEIDSNWKLFDDDRFFVSRRISVNKSSKGYKSAEKILTEKFYESYSSVSLLVMRSLLGNTKALLSDIITAFFVVSVDLDAVRVFLEQILRTTSPLFSSRSGGPLYSVMYQHYARVHSFVDFLRENKDHLTIEAMMAKYFPAARAPYARIVSRLKGDSSIIELLAIIYPDVFNFEAAVEHLENFGVPSIGNLLDFWFLSTGTESGRDSMKALLDIIFACYLVDHVSRDGVREVLLSDLLLVGARVANYLGNLKVAEIADLFLEKTQRDFFISALTTFMNHLYPRPNSSSSAD